MKEPLLHLVWTRINKYVACKSVIESHIQERLHFQGCHDPISINRINKKHTILHHTCYNAKKLFIPL